MLEKDKSSLFPKACMPDRSLQGWGLVEIGNRGRSFYQKFPAGVSTPCLPWEGKGVRTEKTQPQLHVLTVGRLGLPEHSDTEFFFRPTVARQTEKNIFLSSSAPKPELTVR